VNWWSNRLRRSKGAVTAQITTATGNSRIDVVVRKVQKTNERKRIIAPYL
jgi:hypothetical protein